MVLAAVKPKTLDDLVEIALRDVRTNGTALRVAADKVFDSQHFTDDDYEDCARDGFNARVAVAHSQGRKSDDTPRIPNKGSRFGNGGESFATCLTRIQYAAADGSQVHLIHFTIADFDRLSQTARATVKTWGAIDKFTTLAKSELAKHKAHRVADLPAEIIRTLDNKAKEVWR